MPSLEWKDFEKPPTPDQSKKQHEKSDKDGSPKSLHHTLGPGPNQAAAGNHTHDGGNSAALDQLMANITITGSRTDGTALNNLLIALASQFVLTYSSS